MSEWYSKHTKKDLADLIKKLEAERDEVLNQLDSARHSIDVLEKRAKTFSDGWEVADKGRIEAAVKRALEAAAKCGCVFDGPVSISDFITGQATAAQQIMAKIRALDPAQFVEGDKQ